MGEMVLAASECAGGTMHMWPEVGKIEVFDDQDNVPITDGKAGRLILTSLLNTDMPLIRYEIGDRGGGILPDHKCNCSKGLPVLSNIQGRNNDVITTVDGRKIFWMNPVLYNLPVREAQITQQSIKTIIVTFVPAPDFTSETRDIIVKRIQEILGGVEVVMKEVDKVPRGANGKFKAIVSNIDQWQATTQ